MLCSDDVHAQHKYIMWYHYDAVYALLVLMLVLLRALMLCSDDIHAQHKYIMLVSLRAILLMQVCAASAIDS